MEYVEDKLNIPVQGLVNVPVVSKVIEAISKIIIL